MRKEAFFAKHKCKLLIGSIIIAALGGAFFII